ncbi:bile acid:sodium symporter family protein [Fretibacter rubidus]|uniref:bile acid:sodium symporter family protein n=1 Tax=Fretibacter rubidus TaxID=570162 RepID=UPI00352A8F68
MDANAIDNIQLDLGASSEIAMMIILATMMFAVALGLRRHHFAFFKSAPRVYIAGVLAQIIGLPLLTVLICFAFDPQPSIALGMILIACCPGGNTSNLLALFGKADTALSVSLTATSSVAAALITPLSILYWSSLYPPTDALLTEINLDAVSFLIQTLIILALPLFLGMALGHFSPQLADRLQKPLAVIAGVALAVIIIGAVIKFAPVIVALGFGIIALVMVHNGLAFLLGFGAGLVSKANTAQRRALTFEVGIQNSGLGIVILLTQLGGLGGLGGAAAIAGLWGTWHIIGGLMLVALFRFNDRKQSHV